MDGRRAECFDLIRDRMLTGIAGGKTQGPRGRALGAEPATALRRTQALGRRPSVPRSVVSRAAMSNARPVPDLTQWSLFLRASPDVPSNSWLGLPQPLEEKR